MASLFLQLYNSWVTVRLWSFRETGGWDFWEEEGLLPLKSTGIPIWRDSGAVIIRRQISFKSWETEGLNDRGAVILKKQRGCDHWETEGLWSWSDRGRNRGAVNLYRERGCNFWETEVLWSWTDRESVILEKQRGCDFWETKGKWFLRDTGAVKINGMQPYRQKDHSPSLFDVALSCDFHAVSLFHCGFVGVMKSSCRYMLVEP